jgi:hypothetical protein
MADTKTEPNYQDILDKYADSIKPAQAATLQAQPELETTQEPEPLLEAELTPESKLKINPEPEFDTPVGSEPQPEPILESKPEPETEFQPEIEKQPEVETQPQPELASGQLNLTAPPAPEAITTPETPIELAPESSELSPPKENHFFKYLFFFSLFVFIIVLVSIIFSFINSQKSLSDTNNPPTSSSPTIAPVGVCEVNGQTYTVGESFPATDGCNSCSCDENLQIVCTAMACEATTSANQYQNVKYNYSLTFPSSWLNKYNVIETSSGTNFTYKDDPDTKTVLFGINILTGAEWAKVQSEPHGTLISNDIANDRVFTYNIALDTTFTGQKADDFSKMVGDVKKIISTFKSF